MKIESICVQPASDLTGCTSSMQTREQVAVAEKEALLKEVQGLRAQGSAASAKIETLEHNLTEVKSTMEGMIKLHSPET